MDAQALIATVREEVEAAADAMLSAASHGLALVGQARVGQAGALDELERTLCAIIEACAFQDITGQRLSRLRSAGLSVAQATDTLLEGPQTGSARQSQEAADALFNSTGEDA